jgi:hypothetical protein
MVNLGVQEHQFARLVEGDKRSPVSILNEAFASLQDQHMQVQVTAVHAHS